MPPGTARRFARRKVRSGSGSQRRPAERHRRALISELDGVVVMTDGDNWCVVEQTRIVRMSHEQHAELESGSEIDQVGELELVAEFRTAS
jgi:hypothetical protein